MGADLSRIRSNPLLDFAGVQLKQGGVLLDADFNELVAVVDRRLRAAASDILGRSTVSSTTPDGFKITAMAGALSIGKGRLYVDGLLAENHGAASTDPAKKLFDPLMAEPAFADPVGYAAQPYLQDVPALPTTGTHLIYLDVWQRELTYLERPDLVETAVGVETSSRLQTVWQVRALGDDAGGATCASPDDDVAGWSALIAPSSGRLTTGTFDVPPSSDPCELPPTGGYRGLENQTYRVEIQDPGLPGGTATFKWSANNACVGSGVASVVSAGELELQTLGRDDVLRFNSGDWVEIIDDAREFSQRCGEIRKITVNEAARRITFAPALPAEMLPAPPTFPNSDFPRDRNLRVRRWDQKGKVLRTGPGGTTPQFQDLDAAGSTGVIKVPVAGTTLLLENGVTVSFASAGTKGFKAGDFWVFAARTADASVELLTNEPPRGIHHHYERLGIWDVAAGTVTDCRHPWPPHGGCCTVTVEPGEDIQAALDGLPPEGGCVCLKTGVHEIAAPIEIRSSRIILHGEDQGAIVRSTGATTLLVIGAPAQQVRDIVVERIRFEAMAPADAGVVWHLDNCLRVRLAHCQVESVPPSPAALPPLYLGAALAEANNVVITANTFANVMRGVMVADSSRVEISGNTLTAPVLRLGPAQLPLGEFGVLVQAESERPCTIEDNRLQNFWTAVSLEPGADASIVTGNHIRRGGVGTAEGPVPGSAEALREYLDELHFAIDVDAARCIVRGNDIDLTSAFWGGVRASAAHVTIEGNTMESTVKAGSPTVLLPSGIYCRPSAAQAVAADHAIVRENRLAGPQVGIVVSRIDGASVEGNHMDGGGTGWFGVRVDDCTMSRVGTNDIDDMLFGVYAGAGADNRITGNQIRRAALGIAVDAEAGVAVCDNTVQSAPSGGMILLFVTGPTSVADNRIANCGYAPPGILGAMGLLAISLDLLAPSATGIRIEGCEILDTGISADGGQSASGAALGMLVWAPACQVSNNRIAYGDAGGLDTTQQHRAMKILGPLGVRIQLGTGTVEIMFGNALVTGNTLRGPGRHNLAEFQRIVVDDHFDFRFEKVTFSNNICEHLNAEASASEATVRLWGGHLISMGNHVKGPAGVNSMSLAGRSRVALMGNVTTGDYINVGTVTPTPLTGFNVRV